MGHHAAFVGISLVLALGAAGCSGAEPKDEAVADVHEATSASTYTATRYPIVLIPGIMGFKTILGSLDYFSGVPEAIEAGGGQAFVVTASQANSSYVRAAQIIPQLEAIKKATGADRLNLVGHSQGSLEARYIAATRPDLVASVTSVGGPHGGSPVADFVLKIPLGSEALTGLANLFKLVIGSPYPNDARPTLEFLSTKGAAAFAAAYPAGIPTTHCGEGAPVVNGIRYYSWGAVGWLTNPIDLLDVLWPITGVNIPESNDGMVGRCSSHLGDVIRDDYFGNHIDETNMLLGLVFPLGTSPRTLFRNHANRLKKAGL